MSYIIYTLNPLHKSNLEQEKLPSTTMSAELHRMWSQKREKAREIDQTNLTAFNYT
jgi:hypothetical protein